MALAHCDKVTLLSILSQEHHPCNMFIPHANKLHHLLLGSRNDSKKSVNTINSHSTDVSSEIEYVDARDPEPSYWQERALAMSGEISNLKRQVQQRNSAIEHLKETRDQAEKTLNARIMMLDMEVMRSIEARNPASKNTNNGNSCLASRGLEDDTDPNLEISALQELLARVMAERDMFCYRLNNLEEMALEAGGEKCKHDPKQSPPNLHHHEGAGMVYQLRCKECTDHFLVCRTQHDLKRKVMEHYQEIWMSIQDKKSSSKRRKNVLGKRRVAPAKETSCPFGQTSFGKHIVEHCQNMSEEEVMEWCRKHVKVEVLHINDTD
jgi:hypothetical protein